MISTRNTISKFIFSSRWLQAPLYFGLIVVLGIYIFEFGRSLIHLLSTLNILSESGMMLIVLDLIDMVMIANLLIMVILGGFETFVAKLNLQDSIDHPEWLDEVNAGTMKIKLALALVTISSVHLLRTFIEPSQNFYIVLWQVIIHLTLVFSAIAMAVIDKIITSAHSHS